MRWLERYPSEGTPRLKHFADVASDVARREAYRRKRRLA